MEQIYEVLARLAKKSKDEVLSLAKNEDGTDNADFAKNIEAAIADRIKKVGQEQYGRGVKESLTQKQKAIAAKFSISESYDNIEDLFDAIVELQKGSGANDGAASALKEMQDKNKQLLEEVKNAKKSALEAQKKFEADKMLMRIEALANAELDAIGIEFPADQQAAQKARKYFISVLGGYKWAEKDGQFYPTDDTGNALQDDNFEDMTIKALILKNNILPLKQQQTPQQTPNPKGGGAVGGAYKFTSQQLENPVQEVERLIKAGDHNQANALRDAYYKHLENNQK